MSTLANHCYYTPHLRVNVEKCADTFVGIAYLGIRISRVLLRLKHLIRVLRLFELAKIVEEDGKVYVNVRVVPVGRAGG